MGYVLHENLLGVDLRDTIYNQIVIPYLYTRVQLYRTLIAYRKIAGQVLLSVHFSVQLYITYNMYL